jgi:hypothetical protein
MARAQRKPKRYIPGYDIADYAAALSRRFGLKNPPKVPDEIKTARRENALFSLLLDIRYLKLSRIKNSSLIAERLRQRLPKRYPRERPTKATGKMVTPSLRKKVAAALKLLHENPTRVEKMFEQTNELEKRQLKNLAR